MTKKLTLREFMDEHPEYNDDEVFHRYGAYKNNLNNEYEIIREKEVKLLCEERIKDFNDGKVYFKDFDYDEYDKSTTNYFTHITNAVLIHKPTNPYNRRYYVEYTFSEIMLSIDINNNIETSIIEGNVNTNLDFNEIGFVCDKEEWDKVYSLMSPLSELVKNNYSKCV